MNPFEISQAEALLLAFCIDEYSYGKSSTRLLTHIRRGLEAFVPDFDFLSRRSESLPFVHGLPYLPHLHLVQITEHLTLGASCEFAGWIVEIPLGREAIERAIHNEEWQQICHVLLRPERKSLVDLVLVHFGDSLNLSPGECILRQVSTTEAYLKDWPTFVHTFFESKAAPAALNSVLTTKDDDAVRLRRQIEGLSRSNGFEELFVIGGKLGELEGILKRESDRFRFPSDEDGAAISVNIEWGDYDIRDAADSVGADFYCPPIRPQVDSLLEQPIVQRSRYANDLLRSLRDFQFQYRCMPTELLHDYEDDAVFFELTDNLTRCRELVWMALGALLSGLADSEEQFHKSQFDSLTPRFLSDVCEHRPESINQTIQRVGHLLESPHLKPQDAVRMVIAGAEGLIRRVWPSETNSDSGVGKTIREKRQSPSHLERRFATIAGALWHEYRGGAAHEEDFGCSFHEARYFVSGIRAMADLAERIKQEQ